MGEFNVRSVMNLANSIVGVSILAMPYCFSQCGILLGTLLLLSCTLFTAWSCKMLMRAAIMTRNHSYENLALGVYGSWGKYVTGLSIIGLNLGTCIAFFVIIGDLAPPIIAQAMGLQSMNQGTLRAIVLILAAVLIAFPLGLCRSIDSLSGISLCSLLFYSFLTIDLFFVSFPHLSWQVWGRVGWWNNSGLLKCIPIFALAFACQTQLFVIYNALKDPTFRKISSVINGATIAIATLYFLVALFGCVSFTDDGVKGDVLSNFDVNLTSQLFRFGFSLSVVVSFPLMILPSRVSINSLFFSSKALELHVQEPIPQKRFVAITATIIASTLTIAILIPNVETVLGLTGATMGSLVAFILPSLMFLKVAGSKADYSKRAKACAAIGFCVMIFSTGVILQAEMNRSDQSGSYNKLGRRPPPKPPDLPPQVLNPPDLPPEVPKPPDLPPEVPNLPDNVEVPAPVVDPPDMQQVDNNPPPENPGEEKHSAVEKDANEQPAANINPSAAPGGVAKEGAKDGEGANMESLHKEIKQGMNELQSRLEQLEEENRDLKQRQEIIEHIQEEDLIQAVGDEAGVAGKEAPVAEKEEIGGQPGRVEGVPAALGGVPGEEGGRIPGIQGGGNQGSPHGGQGAQGLEERAPVVQERDGPVAVEGARRDEPVAVQEAKEPEVLAHEGGRSRGREGEKVHQEEKADQVPVKRDERAEGNVGGDQGAKEEAVGVGRAPEEIPDKHEGRSRRQEEQQPAEGVHGAQEQHKEKEVAFDSHKDELNAAPLDVEGGKQEAPALPDKSPRRKEQEAKDIAPFQDTADKKSPRRMERAAEGVAPAVGEGVAPEANKEDLVSEKEGNLEEEKEDRRRSRDAQLDSEVRHHSPLHANKDDTLEQVGGGNKARRDLKSSTRDW